MDLQQIIKAQKSVYFNLLHVDVRNYADKQQLNEAQRNACDVVNNLEFIQGWRITEVQGGWSVDALKVQGWYLLRKFRSEPTTEELQKVLDAALRGRAPKVI